MDNNNNNLRQFNQLIDQTLNCLRNLPQNEESVDLRKSLALLYNNRGFIYYKSVEFNLAADDYTTAIKLDPSLGIAYYNRATIHYRMDHFDRAFEDMKTAIKLDPNNPEFKLAFEQTYQQINRNSIPLN